jgi:UPF0755 protein
MAFASRLKKFVIAIIVIAALGVLAGLGGFSWLSQEMDRPLAHGAAQEVITVAPGTSSAAVVARLQEKGILATEWPTLLWLRVFARRQNIKAGDYSFRSPIAPRQVLNQLARGEVSTRTVTIPEGYNQFDIAAVLSALTGLRESPPARPEDLLPLFKKTALIADLDPSATTLEGYLFPDTYEYTLNTTRAQLVEAMVKRFRKIYTPELQTRARELGMTTRQAVTLASLIEKEAKVDSERELISSVFHRRLKLGVPLACDPTVIYAALIEGKYRGKIYRSDLDRDSPYNTYKRAGLPPGPIASPGKRSLQATLYPAETDYLYFVVDATKNDGSHKFSASSADHERAVQVLRQQERAQPSPTAPR